VKFDLGVGGTIGYIIVGAFALVVIFAVIVVILKLLFPIIIFLVVLVIIIGSGFLIYGKIRRR
jgi:hypothetical protein